MRSAIVALALSLEAASLAAQAPAARRPNLLFVIADDWSYPHAGAYGDRSVRTPAFDRVAREGALFANAFTMAPSCTPSRAAILTGQAVHRLAEGGNLHSFLPARFAVYPDLLEKAGYHVGFTGKGWGPGRFEPGGRSRNPAGPRFEDFDDFLAKRPSGQPFCFWFGSADPHRPYEAGSGARAGLRVETVAVPPFLPDTPEVRGDLLDYDLEVQRFDGQLARLLEALQRRGELDDTLVVVTSDNGMPFPRAKANLYDAGTRMPLAIRWPRRVKAGTRIDAFVSHQDFAPTFLEAAGVTVPAEVTGRSLLPLFGAGRTPDRERVFFERERHANVRRGDLSYPARAVRTADFLYVRNYRPERWPAGDPELHFAVGPFGDIDGGPAKQLLLDRRADPKLARFFELATAKRPAEELFDLRKDPAQLVNVAGGRAYAATRERLRKELEKWQRATADPRIAQDDDRWDLYPYYGAPAKQEPQPREFQGPRRLSGAPPAALPPHAVAGGEVFLEVKVSTSGAVTEMKTLRDGPPYTDILRDAVSRWLVEPATEAGAAVPSAFLVAGVFRPAVLVGGAPAGSRTVSDRPACDEIPTPAEVVTPLYPGLGQGDHVVLAEAQVEKDGRVAGVSVVEGSEVFARAASDAARRWRFRPACRQGSPLPARAYLVFGFKAPVVVPPVKR